MRPPLFSDLGILISLTRMAVNDSVHQGAFAELRPCSFSLKQHFHLFLSRFWMRTSQSPAEGRWSGLPRIREVSARSWLALWKKGGRILPNPVSLGFIWWRITAGIYIYIHRERIHGIYRLHAFHPFLSFFHVVGQLSPG